MICVNCVYVSDYYTAPC